MEHRDDSSTDRNALFIARANGAKRFIQSVGIYAISVAVTIVAAVYEMQGLVAVLAVVSAPSAILGFLWFAERKDLFADAQSAPYLPRRYAILTVVFCISLATTVLISLLVGARAGAISHLLLYGVEFLIAASIKVHRTSKGTP